MSTRHSITAAGQLTRFFLTLFIAILLVVNLLFIVNASNLIYRYADDQADEVIETIEKDWASSANREKLLEAYVARQDDDAIEIDDHQQKYQTHKAHKIFKRTSKAAVKIKNLRITRHGIYYLRQGKLDGGRIKVAINVDDLVQLTGWLLGLTIIINFVVIILSIPLIRHLAHRWTKPLTALSQQTNKINPQSNQLQVLTVPEQPREVQTVAQSFNDLLERQFKALQREKEFIANASHELKTPLAGILGHVNLIKRHGDDHPELIAKSLGYIDQEAHRMQRLVSELLLLEGHQGQKLVTSTDLPSIVKAEVNSLRGSYQRHFMTDLPAQLTYQISHGDWQSLVHNLVDNAAKYSPAGSTIGISLRATPKEVILRVADQGKGIAEENRAKIFERFYREDESHASQIPGSGIGLSIVKMIIDKYHGQITVQANQPQGTVVTVSFPVQK
ncbi:sensor histidine kinase [Limosilactobacillus antri]|uniref:histidine kinase n=1 Tax=Limosilactobacillus antri DSM 16041 TaxID=525309 RepID=C8P863_9LACO|nr:HAMP domain-containing sensor histidine kinase [Limosilactobacillus antri]EEW53298.1 ATPase/histidine kinase/DNA gyrase B/HSP90 domain protein [Limosilactobacillus antri DSM 16041]KRK56281.1 histidine protein kinase sensor protein [Limosilactobacillus antri DSM 16041]